MFLFEFEFVFKKKKLFDQMGTLAGVTGLVKILTVIMKSNNYSMNKMFLSKTKVQLFSRSLNYIYNLLGTQ